MKQIHKMTTVEFIQWRRDMDLTQDQAAKLLGFRDRSSICHLEKGRQTIAPAVAMCCRMIQAGDLAEREEQNSTGQAHPH